jgi:hypothetical protein
VPDKDHVVQFLLGQYLLQTCDVRMNGIVAIARLGGVAGSERVPSNDPILIREKRLA